jgi:adenosine/AMP kinase
MKKIIFVIFALILTVESCRKSDYVPTPKVELGKVSTMMSFASKPTLENNYTVSANVTPGSKYSIQITDIKGDVLSSQGLNADEAVETIKLDVEKIKSGIYDLIFIDTKGDEIKQPLIIK